MNFRRRLACSFCSRSAAQVEKLVAGRRAYICDRCAEQTIRIMETSGDPPFAAPPSLLRRIVGRLWPRTSGGPERPALRVIQVRSFSQAIALAPQEALLLRGVDGRS